MLETSSSDREGWLLWKLIEPVDAISALESDFTWMVTAVSSRKQTSRDAEEAAVIQPHAPKLDNICCCQTVPFVRCPESISETNRDMSTDDLCNTKDVRLSCMLKRC